MNAIVRAIIEPWGWEGALSAYWPIIVEGALVSVALGVIGCFLVVRGMSLLGDALSHSVLPGIVIGFLIGGTLHSVWILVGATAIGMLAATMVQTVQQHSRVKADASLGIVFTTMFAIGVLMINLYAGQADLDPGCVLYGNIEHFVIQPQAIWPMAIIGAGVLAGVAVFYRHLLVSTFDPGLGQSLGIPVRRVHYGLMAALSLTVVASFEAVGAILAVALLIMPGATARLWTDRLPRMLLLAGVHGVASTLIGYWLSHEAVVNTSASGAMSVAGFGLFLASWLLAPAHGLVPRAIARRALARTVAMENLLKAVGELRTGGVGTSAGEAELATRLGARRGALARTLDLARGRAWVRRDGERVTLTTAGEHQAERLRRAHELWEEFLKRKLGLGEDHVHDAAEWVEHHLSEEKMERIGKELGEGK